MLVLNLIHRPELEPEYALEGAGVAKEKIERESLEIFLLQQEIAHKNGLKTTIQMTYASLFSPLAVEIAKKHHEQYGDEISLTLLGLDCPAFREKFPTRDFCIWMFSKEDKRAIVDDVFEKFYEVFGFYPESTGSYFLDAYTINYIKEKYPSVKAAVATCFEEGPKAYHTTNNSWYTFMDGGPWNPWIPSKVNSHIPARNKQEDSGIVAIPHLSRDLNACFDGNGSNFGTHPQNVLRGMIYKDGEYPYIFNLIDQYHHLGNYNAGYGYNMMFVGPGWMNKKGRWEAPHSLLVKSYEDTLAYYGELKKRGELIDMGMAEYADFYRENHSYGEPEVALWNDILYGGNKQYYWYYDPSFRFLADLNQGGAIIDLRPYIGDLGREVGIDTPHVVDASYPFLIQAHYRAGYFTHYKGEGTLKSLRVHYKGEVVDLALCRTKGRVVKKGQSKSLLVDPVEIVFSDGLTLTIQTKITVKEGDPTIYFERALLDISNEAAEVVFEEYVTATYGTTEYPEDMKVITLKVENEEEAKTLDYEYKDRLIKTSGGVASALIPPLNVAMKISGEDIDEVSAHEGYAFSPMFTLSAFKTINKKGVMKSWLNLEKKN